MYGLKAVYLQLVIDFSAKAFLVAYKRFIVKQGLCSEIYSDYGTKFVREENQIDKERRLQL